MQFAQVVIDVPTRALEQAFSYEIPSELAAATQIGCCVLVDFAHRKQLAYVVDVSQQSPPGAANKIKAIEQVLSEPLFSAAAAQLASWIATEYAAALSEAIHLFLPPGAGHKLHHGNDGSCSLLKPTQHAVEDFWISLTATAAAAKIPANATKQIAVLQTLQAGALLKSELNLAFSNITPVISALTKRGVIEVQSTRRFRGNARSSQADEPIAALTAGQNAALEAIEVASMQTDEHAVIVLDGACGSGKTEVYLQAIAKVQASGGSAIVLVPEISLTPQTVARFRARFGDKVAVLHSRLSAGERYDQWDLVRLGKATVVIGARSALFAPVKNLQLIVIDEEHDQSYKQGSSPRYHARDVAVAYAKITGATVILGSATPSLETLHNCDVGIWQQLLLPERTGAHTLPEVAVVDLAAEFKAQNRSMFSRILKRELLATIERGEKAILLLNRRGFASFLLCRDCGFVPECANCSTSLTYHLDSKIGGRLMCHHCGASHQAPSVCPECGSPYLKQLGKGTQFVAKELESIVPPGTPIVRMDADTTRGKDAHERLLEQFIAASYGVLLGTQMIAKGLDFPDVTLVGVMLADTALRLPDFRAPERTYQLLEQVAGRAGRADKLGKVIVQSYMPEHVAIRSAAAHERNLLYDFERELRLELGYPPYRRFANFLIWGAEPQAVSEQAMALAAILDGELEQLSDWLILGPNPCVFSRRKKDYRWHIVLSAPANAEVGTIARQVLKRLKKCKGVNTSIDVDPFDLL